MGSCCFFSSCLAERSSLGPQRSAQLEKSFTTLNYGFKTCSPPFVGSCFGFSIKPAKQTVGGIYLPESSQKKMNEATVLAVGPGALGPNGELIPVPVKVGGR